MTITTTPTITALGPCPSWCAGSHEVDNDRGDLSTLHQRECGSVAAVDPDLAGQHPEQIAVTVEQYVLSEDGHVSSDPRQVWLRVTSPLRGPAMALVDADQVEALGRSLLHAADVLRGARDGATAGIVGARAGRVAAAREQLLTAVHNYGAAAEAGGVAWARNTVDGRPIPERAQRIDAAEGWLDDEHRIVVAAVDALAAAAR